MNTIKILAIGNSFSTDATRYLHQLAAAAGMDILVVNLFVGGCSLEQHWQFMERNEPAYLYELNGSSTERYVTLDEALEEENWDYVVTQQASRDVGWVDSYEPFLGILLDRIKEKVPLAKVYLQETWAYEIGHTDPYFMRYNKEQKNMYDRLHYCYTTMAEKYNLGLIPSGTIIQQVRSTELFCVPNGGCSLCRDGFHMSLGYGRYLLACIWLKTITDISLKEVEYTPDDPELAETLDKNLLDFLKDCVEQYEGN